MVRGPIRYGMRYSATRQFVSSSTTALHLRRGFCTLVLFIDTVLLSTNHLAEDLVDGCRLLQCTLLDHLCPLLLHEQHEGIEGLLDVRLLLLYLLHGIIYNRIQSPHISITVCVCLHVHVCVCVCGTYLRGNHS